MNWFKRILNWLAFEFLGIYSPSRIAFDKKYQEKFRRRNRRWKWLEGDRK